MMNKTIQKLIKNENIQEWQEKLNDNEFLNQLSSFIDDKGNNIYHLLAKHKNIIYAAQVVQFLLNKNIPVLHYNQQDKSPSNLAKGILHSLLNQQELKEIQEKANIV